MGRQNRKLNVRQKEEGDGKEEKYKSIQHTYPSLRELTIKLQRPVISTEKQNKTTQTTNKKKASRNNMACKGEYREIL